MADTNNDLVAIALNALDNPADPYAKDWTLQVVEEYGQMTSPTGVYNTAATFSEIRQFLHNERDQARKLARRIDAVTRRMRATLKGLNGGIQEVDQLIGNRVEVARNLDRHAEEIDSLEKHWPKGGARNLAKAAYGSPKKWLVGQCLKIFWHYGKRSSIRPTTAADGSPFAEFVGAVYELATGDDPEAKGVGLNKVIDQTARTYRRNDREHQHKQATD